MISMLVIVSYPAQAGRPTQWMPIPFATPDSPNAGVMSMAVFKDKLFAGSQDYEKGLRIWRMERDGAWEQVTEAGLATRCSPLRNK